MRILKAAAISAAAGSVIAAVMIALDQTGPFSIPVNSFIDREIFTLCPFYALGFSNDVTSKAVWFSITVAGNAILYGALFALLALGGKMVQRLTARKPA